MFSWLQAKLLLEEAQRVRRKAREKNGIVHSPRWFKKKSDPCDPKRMVHVYQGGYWEGKARGFEGEEFLPLYKVDWPAEFRRAGVEHECDAEI